MTRGSRNIAFAMNTDDYVIWFTEVWFTEVKTLGHTTPRLAALLIGDSTCAAVFFLYSAASKLIFARRLFPFMPITYGDRLG